MSDENRPSKRLRLFGVTMTSIREPDDSEASESPDKSGNSSAQGPEAAVGRPEAAVSRPSDGTDGNDSNTDRKQSFKTGHWTEEEHQSFLRGLQRLGNSDYVGISKRFVITRTPAQVRSHAQKYHIRRLRSYSNNYPSSFTDIDKK